MIQTLLLAFAALPLHAPAADVAAPGAPKNLRLEYLVEPLGLDERKPRFSFELDDARRGARQSAYQILVSRSPGEIETDVGSIWDSGKVESKDTCQIAYGGSELESFSHYWWKVRSYDAEGKPTPWSAVAHWSTGAVQPIDWKGAWICDAQPVSEFKPGGRGWCSQFSAKEDDYKWVKFDLGKGAVFDTVKLYPAAAEDGSNKPWALFSTRFNVWGSDYPDFDSISRVFKVIDQGEFDAELPESGPLVLKTKSRMKMEYVLIGFTKLAKDEQKGFGAALAEVEFSDSQTQTVVSTGAPAWASDSREENGWSIEKLTDGIEEGAGTGGDEPLPQPLLRTEFEARGAVARATLSYSAFGLCEVSLNGQRITQDVLAPGWSDYRKHVASQTADVTQLVAAGKNAIGVQLADGWFAGRVGLAQIFVGGPRRGLYGRKPAFSAQLDIEYADGKHEIVVSNEGWKSTLTGPLLASDLLDGETYDARRELSGWDKPGYDDKSWKTVDVLAGGATLHSQRSTPVRIVGELQPVSVKALGPNRWLYDFGRNVSGWCRMRGSAQTGSELVLRHGEALDADGALYTANLRSALQTDRYVFKGGPEETFEPRFTTHGFRYVEASFPAAKPTDKLAQPALAAEIVSNSAEVTGSFHAQHPVLTKLWENIGTTLRANITSVPTDCPQRDERLGWMGDIQVFAPTALYHSDLAPFFTQWLQSVRDGASSTHRFSDFSPNPFNPEVDFVGAPGWADAGVFVPYDLYLATGDKRALELALPFATRWVDFVADKNPDGLWKNERGNDYGDWLNGSQIESPGWNKEGCELDKEVFATAIFARSAEITGLMAAVTGRNEIADRYLKLSDKIRSAFQKAYLKPDGTIQGDTQAGYALALAFDLVPKNLVPLVQAKLSVSITEKRAWHLTTGMQTTQHLFLELAQRGYEELASRLVRSKEFPSWGWQIEQGATSLWERWDGFVPGRGFQDPGMNSFNHYAFGAVGEYLMTCIGGIELDPDAPGFEHFFVHPRAGLQIPSAGARLHTLRGTIESDWKLDGDRFVLDVTVPPNTSATVVIPALSVESVKEGGKSVIESGAPHILPLDYKKGLPGAEIAGRAWFDVRAGKYHFESQFRVPAPK